MGGRPEEAQHEVPQGAEDDHEAEEGDHVTPERQLAAVPCQKVLRGDVRELSRHTAVELGVDSRAPEEGGERGVREVVFKR